MSSLAILLLLAAPAAGDAGPARPGEMKCPSGTSPTSSRGRPPPPPGAPAGELQPEVTQLVCKDAQGRRQGPFVARTDAGVVTARGSFVDDRPDGAWTFYTLDGKKLAEMKVDHGVQAGETLIYYPSGKLRGRTTPNADGHNLFNETFYESGAKSSVLVVDRTTGVGHYIGFYENGRKSTEGTADGAVRRGIWYEWDEEGQLVTTTAYDEKGNMTSCAGPGCPAGSKPVEP